MKTNAHVNYLGFFLGFSTFRVRAMTVLYFFFFLFLMPNSARVLFFFVSFLWQPCLFSTRASLSFLFFLACFGHACYVVNEAPSFRTEIGS